MSPGNRVMAAEVLKQRPRLRGHLPGLLALATLRALRAPAAVILGLHTSSPGQPREKALVLLPDGCEAAEMPFLGVPAMAATAATAMGVAFLASALSTRRAKNGNKVRCAVCHAFRDGSESRSRSDLEFKDSEAPEAPEASQAPGTFYELFDLPPDATSREIKKAYHDMQKLCHPDVAGDDASEMCILLNDAYDILSDESTREDYNAKIKLAVPEPLPPSKPEVEKDCGLGPSWTWSPKVHNKSPVYTGKPRSRSNWAKLLPAHIGAKHKEELFVFVDEWKCIACRNCCDVAPQTFCIDAENGRARVFTQWGNSEEYLDYAVEACPVNCITWTNREELQLLEHVTAEEMFNSGGYIDACPMMIRNGGATADTNPWVLANKLQNRLMDEEASKRRRLKNFMEHADNFRVRLSQVFSELPFALKHALQSFKAKQTGHHGPPGHRAEDVEG